MAYTYDDFVNAAKNAGMYDSFGQEDLVMAQSKPEYGLSLLKLQQDAGKATTEEQKLLVQEAVNQLRNTYGVKLPATTTGAGSGFSYDRETDYQKLLNGISTPSSFDFDHRTDPTYGAIKDSWIADGNRTQSSVLQGATVPKTDWAKNAAQQSNNYYDAQLTDQIPTIYQNAFEEHLNNQNNELSKFGALTTDKAFDYAADLQQKQLDQTSAQQKFTNDMTLHQTFGTAAPTMPDLDNLTPGAETKYNYGKDTEHKQALDAVINQNPFSYEHLTDPLYGAMRKTALREGDRVAGDTLAELNARTGGVASSYGVRAASDAGNQLNQDLNAAIPGLRKTAYQEYLGDFEGKIQGLGALEEDRAFDYQKWLQDYQLKEAAKQQEFENALALYKQVGLTPEIAEILGVPYVAPSSGGSGYRKPKPDDNKDDYSAEDYLNSLVSGKNSKGEETETAGYDRNESSGQSNVKKTITKAINDAVKAGAITKSKAQELKKTYTGSGKTGRVAY